MQMHNIEWEDEETGDSVSLPIDEAEEALSKFRGRKVRFRVKSKILILGFSAIAVLTTLLFGGGWYVYENGWTEIRSDVYFETVDGARMACFDFHYVFLGQDYPVHRTDRMSIAEYRRDVLVGTGMIPVGNGEKFVPYALTPETPLEQNSGAVNVSND